MEPRFYISTGTMTGLPYVGQTGEGRPLVLPMGEARILVNFCSRVQEARKSQYNLRQGRETLYSEYNDPFKVVFRFQYRQQAVCRRRAMVCDPLWAPPTPTPSARKSNDNSNQAPHNYPINQGFLLNFGTTKLPDWKSATAFFSGAIFDKLSFSCHQKVKTRWM